MYGATSGHKTLRPDREERRGWRAEPGAGCPLSNKWPLPGSQGLNLPFQGSKLNSRQLFSLTWADPAQGGEKEGQDWTVCAPFQALPYDAFQRASVAGAGIVPFDRGGN